MTSIHPPLAVNQPCSSSALGCCVLHCLDDVGRSSLTREQVHHSGVESVADVASKSGIHPQLHVIRLAHSFDDVLEVLIGDRIIGFGGSRDGAERSGIFLLIRFLGHEVDEIDSGVRSPCRHPRSGRRRSQDQPSASYPESDL